MIHRHKHEMTLKFPSIKTDNMLSGKGALSKHISCMQGTRSPVGGLIPTGNSAL
jgi:hypothetical protein